MTRPNMPSENPAFERLSKIFSEITHLRGIKRLLSWDQETYMPQMGQENRAEQAALLSSLIHEKSTSKEVGDLIEELSNQVENRTEEDDIFVCFREWKRIYDRQTKLPSKLVEELSRQSVLAHGAWVEARKQGDFSIFLPSLKRLITLSKEKAHHLGFHQSPYDALLDEFEPDTTTADVETMFSGLVEPLKRLMQKIEACTRKKIKINGTFDRDRQKVFAQMAAASIGFDFRAGRLDTVVHPFSTKIGPGDCRITSRWNVNDFTEGFFGVLHEAGHGMYSQNLPGDKYGTPLGESVSLGIHESQSRFWENFVGRSRPFWVYFLPIAKSIFPGQIDELTLDEFLLAINRVEPSFIRVEADEVTYNLHVYLRFIIEREIFEDRLAPEDIPARWNQLFYELFGLKVPNDAQGCLQDVHWSGAAFGYFPTYTLGNIYAAMLHEAIGEAIPQIDELMARANFDPILSWLKEYVHRLGQRYRPLKLIEQATKKRPSHKPLVRYLEEKYSALYL